MELKCPECGNKDVQYRVRDKIMVCRHCGYRGKRKEFQNPSVKNKLFKCPKCSSMSVEYRFREEKILCRRCGYKGNREEFVEEE